MRKGKEERQRRGKSLKFTLDWRNKKGGRGRKRLRKVRTEESRKNVLFILSHY